jgi:cytoskeleton protein RodZ
MGSFGENLRREREMRGVTLREIAESTKISVRFLDALESEEFSKLPGGIFTRSFIRSYAGYLGLDPEQVLAEFLVVVPPKNDEDFSRIGVNHSVGRGTAGNRTVFAWMVAVTLLAGGYFLFRYSHQHADTLAGLATVPKTAEAAPVGGASDTPTAGAVTHEAALGTPNPVTGTATSAPGSTANAHSGANPLRGALKETAATTTPGTLHGPGGQTASQPVAGTQLPPLSQASAATPANAAGHPPVLGDGNMVLQVAATERSWVAVECDGKTLLQRILNPGEVRTLRAKDYFNVTTGNAQGVTLTLDGQALQPLGRYGEVKTIRLTLADLKRPTANP